eukprot:TRINITY_DN65686_c0_g1_i1.p1 TRINITY_DN65686_c0_g1~~TRINITY_DN65686_c0_g1_i1.p1  ORF type:complete len:639 (+),score=123.60 TRINITY_DN65686_c0_g1_i1:74-1918(+)
MAASNSAEVKAVYKKATENLTGQMCYTIEWCDEDLPVENQDMTALDRRTQELIDQTQGPQGLLEHFRKPKQDKLPQLPAPPSPGKESVLVFADAGGFCKAILESAPPACLGQTRFVTDPPGSLSQAQVKSLLGKGWDLVVFGCGLDLPESNEVLDIVDHQRDVARLFFYLVKELNRDDALARRVAVLTRGVFSDDAELQSVAGVRLATHGTLFGLVNTVRLEVSTIPFQFIETEYSHATPAWKQEKPTLLTRLATELFRTSTFGHNAVRIMHDGRYVLRHQRSTEYEAAKHQFLVPEHGVIAITGGNGALGLVMGEWLLKQAEAQKVGGFAIYFLSRSAKVNDQGMSTWKVIEKKAQKLNITVEQRKCDFSTQVACDAFVREHAPNLYGIIHSAGVLTDKMLASLEWDAFETSWNAKSRAALYLHDALERYPNPGFAFFWMFSSTAVYGNMGQTNYSAANAYLDALCRHRRAAGKPGLAIQWGAWGEVGMAANLDANSKQRFAQSPVPPFSTKDGLAGMEAGLRTGLPGVTVHKVNPAVMFKFVESCGTPGECYFRNFYSKIIPTTGAPSLERQHVYTMYRMLMDGYHNGYSKRIIFDRYIQPEIDDELDSNWW